MFRSLTDALKVLAHVLDSARAVKFRSRSFFFSRTASLGKTPGSKLFRLPVQPWPKQRGLASDPLQPKRWQSSLQASLT